MKRTRRTFIQRFGTALLTFSPATTTIFDAKSSRKLRIGLLIPEQPSEGVENFITGLKLNQEFNQHFSIIKEPTRLSSFYKIVKSIKKLQRNGVDVIISFANKRVSHHVLDSLPTLKIPYIQSGLGVNHCPALKKRPFYFEHTLNYYEAAYFAGQYAGLNYGDTASLVAGVFDTGFDHFMGFQKGFKSVGGKILNLNAVQSKKDLNRAINTIKTTQPSVVFCLFSEGEGSEFLAKLNQFDRASAIKVLSNHPFHLKKDTSANYQYLSTWANQLDPFEDNTFHKLFRKKNKQKTPDAYAMLGYETAELLAASLESNYRYVYSMTKTFSKSEVRVLRKEYEIESNQVHAAFQWFTPKGKVLATIKDTSTAEYNYFVPDKEIVSG